MTRRRNAPFSVVLLGVFAIAGSLSADTDPVINLTWDHANGNAWGNYYISPYYARVTEWSNETIALYCIDFNHEIAPPYVWTAHLSAINDVDLDNATYGVAGGTNDHDLEFYSRAAWLITQSLSADARGQDIYQYAAWGLFVDSAHKGNWESSAGSLLTDAQTAIDASKIAWDNHNIDAAGWRVVTGYPVNGQVPQEFITHMPEPSSVLLFGSCLLSVCGVLRKRMNRQ
jgi:hypothetical protein